MNEHKNANAGFTIESNVHIEIKDTYNNSVRVVDKHNRATQKMVNGILQFLKGNFNTSYRQKNPEMIINSSNAKNFIPCYVGAGTYGIRVGEDGLPDYDSDNRRNPPIDSYLSEDYASYYDTHLKKEIDSGSRVEIGILDNNSEEATRYLSSAVNCEQFVLWVDVEPSTYTNIAYSRPTDIFITELGLFPTPTPNDDTLLARVVFKDEDDILYVRPQDTILIRWTICILSLTDTSEYIDEQGTETDVDSVIGNLTITDERE